MDITPTKEQIQKLQDMLELAVNQRTSAHNECLQLGAELVAAKRQINELEAKIKELEEDEVIDTVRERAHANGATDSPMA